MGAGSLVILILIINIIVQNLLGKLETEEQRNKENEKKGEIKKYDNFVTALETLLSVWEYAATNSSDPDKKEQRDMVLF